MDPMCPMCNVIPESDEHLFLASHAIKMEQNLCVLPFGGFGKEGINLSSNKKTLTL